ncbi:hypothetical protein [Acrocarpospora catenulata]|uniref:hypothetical protein n=1 Tax=Acrocarpospora catenulata TaxID=2836182 RepID=UPI001BDA582C|nr:hypothetical protein [Acrocarpospora catenulata]
MKKIICVAALAATTVLTTAGTGFAADSTGKEQVSHQCSYLDRQATRQDCHPEDGRAWDHNLDCRRYSNVIVCGKLRLSKRQIVCLRESIRCGMSYRRAEVECSAFVCRA